MKGVTEAACVASRPKLAPQDGIRAARWPEMSFAFHWKCCAAICNWLQQGQQRCHTRLYSLLGTDLLHDAGPRNRPPSPAGRAALQVSPGFLRRALSARLFAADAGKIGSRFPVTALLILSLLAITFRDARRAAPTKLAVAGREILLPLF